MRIRQGNDFLFLWTIVRSGIPEDLDNAKNIRLHFKNYDCVSEVKSFQIVDGNIVRVEVSPEWASRLGAYRLILSYEFENHSYSDGDRKCVVDVLAFNIVPKTSEADDLTEVTKTTDIMIGFFGLSAYEVWLKDNPDSTKEDYYNWLRQPATDAVSLIDDKIEHLDEVIDSSTANEAERVGAENIRLSNEIGRVNAETQRETNEAERLANEASRVSDELIRETNESTREQDEAIRKTNESERETAEATRVSNENNRVTAEQERVDAESLRVTAESSRESAESLRVEAELLRQSSTQEAIGNAENATENANTAAQNADNARLAIQDDLALKANHGYESNPKTLKEVEDSIPDIDAKYISTFNVSKLAPTGGIDGTNKYTLELAIAKLNSLYNPSQLFIKQGIKIQFVSQVGETVKTYVNEKAISYPSYNSIENWKYVGDEEFSTYYEDLSVYASFEKYIDIGSVGDTVIPTPVADPAPSGFKSSVIIVSALEGDIFEVHSPQAHGVKLYAFIDINNKILEVVDEASWKKVYILTAPKQSHRIIIHLRNKGAQTFARRLTSPLAKKFALSGDTNLTLKQVEDIARGGGAEYINSPAYGIRWSTSQASTKPTRIGNMDSHKTLPIQNKMRRCLLLDDGTVNYYLDANDSTKKEDGSPAILDGTDGQVMVEIPAHWVQFSQSGDIKQVLLSSIKTDGFTFIPKQYISAYEANLNRPENKLSSVVNNSIDYRGGDNDSERDGTSATSINMPVTSMSREEFRVSAKTRGEGWTILNYNTYNAVVWLFYVEYAELNSQLPFISSLTSEGYKQGGLGKGVTDLDTNKLSSFNERYPFIPQGFTNSLGNNTGIKNYEMPPEYSSDNIMVEVNSYRGIQNIFGHIGCFIDGVSVIQSPESIIAVKQINPDDYGKRINEEVIGNVPNDSSRVKETHLGSFIIDGDVVGAFTHHDDGYIAPLAVSSKTVRVIEVGGNFGDGGVAGLTSISAYYGISFKRSFTGTRLCYYVPIDDENVGKNKIVNSPPVHASNYRSPSLASGGVVSFIDDDGRVQVYTDWYPFMKALNAPIGVAINTADLGGLHLGRDPVMSPEQLEIMAKDTEIVEILNHGKHHYHLDSLSEQDLMEEIYDPIKYFSDRGIFSNGFVIPFGHHNPNVLRKIQQYYHACYDFSSTVLNSFDNIQNSAIRRTHYGKGREFLTQHKTLVDEAVANNSWLVITTHLGGSAYWDSQTLADLQELVEYIRAQGATIMLPRDAFQIFGNIAESDNGFAIQANGIIRNV